MKIKNIMFSGAMASILMIGGAYADNQTTAEPTQFTTTGLSADSRLASAQYVKEGVAAAEAYAKQYTDYRVEDLDATVTQATDDNGLSASVEEVDGKLTSVSVGVTAAESVASGNAQLITSGVVYSGAKNALYDNKGENNAARSIADVIAANESAIASLQEQAGTGTVGDQIDEKIAELDATVSATADNGVTATVKEEDGIVTEVSVTVDADTEATQNSEKLITSGGVYTELAGKQANLSGTTGNVVLYGESAGQTGSLGIDTTVGANDTNLVTSGAVETAINGLSTTYKTIDAYNTDTAVTAGNTYAKKTTVGANLDALDQGLEDLNTAKQAKLTASSYISIDEDNKISVTDVATEWNSGATPSSNS